MVVIMVSYHFKQSSPLIILLLDTSCIPLVDPQSTDLFDCKLLMKSERDLSFSFLLVPSSPTSTYLMK